MTQKSVLVTGASAGKIGHALVLAFQQAGFLVFSCVRDASASDDLAKMPNVHIITLDITSSASITAAVEIVRDRTSGAGLDVLMNSCRVEFVMPLLDYDVREGKRLFDINVWGTLAMIKAFTPQLVGNKGMVVNMSSIAGFIHSPWLGLYAASESALNTLSETLRLELAPFNVKVLTIVSGAVKADIYKKPGEFSLPPDSIYAPIASKVADVAEGKTNPEMMETHAYALKVVADVLKERNGLVYRGNWATVTHILSWSPSFILDGIVSAKRGLDELAKYLKG
ncbi:oxidoreductase, short-chain dehydrogenase/reductase family [Sclerotinia borealis F-4128]|uniref:Oxidoreductase, short-chain dehydrogenase/reductase family n=1 Tax=Sclerotinia borealis (strain F-4128) TaxID=1432307 RepID=W9CHJ6_SCLBF|nr:oxidoreductase, short-chain dehydrogenase/reductase family [Sclerotinia borealis F-4128]